MAKMIIDCYTKQPVVVPSSFKETPYSFFNTQLVKAFIEEWGGQKDFLLLTQYLKEGFSWESFEEVRWIRHYLNLTKGKTSEVAQDSGDVAYKIFKQWIEEIEAYKPPTVEDFL